MINKRKILFTIIVSVCAYGSYWLCEPFSLIPFLEQPKSLSQNNDSFSCPQLRSYSAQADSLVNAAITRNDFLGISTGVYSENCGTWLTTAGFLNKRDLEKPNQSSRFRLASISKPMTAIAIFQLYEHGKIELDIPIQNYVKEFPKKDKGEITIRQLLNHTSGLPYFKKKFESVHFEHYDNCVAALDRFKEKKLEHTPGKTFLYSSYGYTLLGAVIEKVSGKSYRSYMKEHIWDPTGMTNTDIENVEEDYQNRADTYIKYGTSFFRFPQNDLSYSYSGGGLQSTADDLLKFGKAILNFELIEPETTEMMIKLSDRTEKENKYLHGWKNWVTPHQGQVVEHGGKQIGCSSFFRIYFDKRAVVTTLANNTNSREEVLNLSIDLSYLLLEMENE